MQLIVFLNQVLRYHCVVQNKFGVQHEKLDGNWWQRQTAPARTTAHEAEGWRRQEEEMSIANKKGASMYMDPIDDATGTGGGQQRPTQAPPPPP